ncbi:MAG: PHP domain-containing protein, partial [Alphaproteobacteria bacterium]
MTAYAELQVTTNFSFLRSGSHPQELVLQAAALGHGAIAVTDRNTLAGVVRAHVQAKEAGIKLLVGARLDLACGHSLLCFPTDRAAYGRLSRLLSLGRRRAPKGECELHLADLADHAKGQIAIALPRDESIPFSCRPRESGDPSLQRRNSAPKAPRVATWPLAFAGATSSGTNAEAREFADFIARIAGLFPGRAYLAAQCLYRGDDEARLAALAALGWRAGLPLVATNDVHYHVPARRPLQDVLTCIREHCTLDEAGFRLFANAERHLKSPDDMARLFRAHPDAVARTMEIAGRIHFSLDELRYEYPVEPVPEGRTAQEELERLTWIGAARRYPGGLTEKVRSLVERELKLIGELNYAPYFLTVNDIVREAREREILCQGRGSAANSAVCYVLGITAVDPDITELLFERFVSSERKEPPDIDVDFEHERREEIIQYIYEKYGRDRAGLAATVISYRERSAIRDVGKALGLSLDTVDRLAKSVWGWGREGLEEEALERAGFPIPKKGKNPPLSPRGMRGSDAERRRGEGPSVKSVAHGPSPSALSPSREEGGRLRLALQLARELEGFPRHLSQHVGGFVITKSALGEVVPIENAAMEDRTVVEWDKDDLDALGILKIDVLGLGMLTCLRKGFELIRQHYGKTYDLATIPQDDKAVYDMLCEADTLGVFQVESRAQMSMLPRLKPRNFYDIVIEVAIVRPGPIQGDMV